MNIIYVAVHTVVQMLVLMRSRECLVCWMPLSAACTSVWCTIVRTKRTRMMSEDCLPLTAWRCSCLHSSIRLSNSAVHSVTFIMVDFVLCVEPCSRWCVRFEFLFYTCYRLTTPGTAGVKGATSFHSGISGTQKWGPVSSVVRSIQLVYFSKSQSFVVLVFYYWSKSKSIPEYMYSSRIKL